MGVLIKLNPMIMSVLMLGGSGDQLSSTSLSSTHENPADKDGLGI